MPQSLFLKQNILVKTVVTKEFKENYLKELNSALSSTKAAVEQIKSSVGQLILKGAGSSYDEVLKAQLQEEKAKQESLSLEIQTRILEVEKLELGSIYLQGAIEGLVEVKVGDNLFKKISKTEILIQDGIILALKEE